METRTTSGRLFAPGLPVLLLVALGVLAGSTAATAAPRQAVAVAFLEPRTEIDVDVTTGAMSIGGYAEPFDEPPEEQVGLAGFLDPYTHSLFVNRTGGIPGVNEPDRALGVAQVPAQGLPSWTAPTIEPTGGGTERVVLADGRYAEVVTDTKGRVTAVRWPVAGARVTSTIDYIPAETTVRMPFGIRRSYFQTAGLVTRVLVPGAHRHSRQDTVGGRLDTLTSRQRRHKRLPVFSRAENTIDRAAKRSLVNVFSDEPANGGYTIFGVDSANIARRVNATIRRLGLLDVAEAIPERGSFSRFKRDDAKLAPLFKLLGECVVSTGVRFGAGVDVDIARTITAAEVLRLDEAVSALPDWVYVYYGSESECSTAV